jgi:hypothetical protein
MEDDMTRHANRAQKDHSEPRTPNFLQRHRDGFIVVVSLLLLLSLVVKELIRDKSKEEADTLDSLRNMFYLKIDTLRIPNEIMANIDVINRIPPGATIPPDQLETQLEKQLKIDFESSMSANHMVDTLSSLAKDLDLSEKDLTTLEDIENRNIERGNAFKKTGEALQRHDVKAEDYDAAVRIAADTSLLDWNILDFGTALADQADHEVKKLRKEYKWSAWVSYLLALALWYFAVLGKLYGVDLSEDIPG